jgi:hypothetical protein
MIKPIERKILRILSDGSLSVSFNYFSNSTQFLFYEKDNKNFNLNKKQNVLKTQIDEFSNYKKKYLV